MGEKWKEIILRDASVTRQSKEIVETSNLFII